MKIKPDSVYGQEVTFGDDETGTVQIGKRGTVNISEGRVSLHLGLEGVSSSPWDKPTYYHPNGDHNGFVTITTESGMNVFLSIAQAEAVAQVVEEATERESCDC